MKSNGLSSWLILLQAIFVIIFAVIIAGCAETNQDNTVTSPQPESGQNNAFTAPQPGREQINKFITPQEAFTLMQENQNNPHFFIIDDRPQSQFNQGHIANAMDISWGADFADRLGKLDKNGTYVVYCPVGCGQTSKIMKQLGFKEVYEIQGGLQAWTSKGLPLVK